MPEIRNREERIIELRKSINIDRREGENARVHEREKEEKQKS